jgi:hypothetical protein
MSVNPSVPFGRRDGMYLKAFAVMAFALGALALAAVAAAAVINGTPGDDVLRGTDQADRDQRVRRERHGLRSRRQ